jgi:hypothetical protein
MREQELSLRDVIAKLKDRIEAETLKSKEYGGKIKTALEQLQEECSAHDDTKVTRSNFSPEANRKLTHGVFMRHMSYVVVFSPRNAARMSAAAVFSDARAGSGCGENWGA